MWPTEWSQETWAIVIVGCLLAFSLEGIRRLIQQELGYTHALLEEIRNIVQEAPWHEDPLDETLFGAMSKLREDD